MCLLYSFKSFHLLHSAASFCECTVGTATNVGLRTDSDESDLKKKYSINFSHNFVSNRSNLIF